jgi:hypothetical protein
MMKTEEIKEKIKSKNGRFFSVEFTKKDGTNRVMLCRTGVKKFLNPSAKPKKRNENIQVVYDVHKKAYRSFNYQSVIKLN